MTRNGVMKTPSRKTTPTDNVIKEAIEVFCRVRPLTDDEESCVEILNDRVLQINNPRNLKSVQSRIEQVQCTFNKIFAEDVTQSQMFEQVGLPLVQDLLQGKNALCFMYGITGSGKTYTMNGESADGGVLPRSLDCIFNSIKHLQTPRCVFKPDGYNMFTILSDEDAQIEAKTKYSDIQDTMKKMETNELPRCPDTTTLEVEEDNNYAVFVSFVEIYNNSVFDLLEDVIYDKLGQPKPPGSKILREDRRGNIFVYEASEVEVKSTEEAFSLFRMGHYKRKTAHTLLNTESSRSHCVLTIKLVQAPLGPSGDTIMKDINLIGISQLSLCDLAGSERIRRTKTEGEKVKQAGHINNSLMTLRTCIEILRENQKNSAGGNKMVPYRDSKLTHLFRNYFDGDGKLRMVVCLNPKIDDFDESLHVMKFAEMTQEVKIAKSEGVKFDLGLTPGRGKANVHFKAMRDEDTVSEMGSQESILAPLQQFAPWPLIELSSYNDTTTLTNLMHYLEERNKLRQTLYSDWKQKHMEVRKMILQLEQDNIDLTKALEEQRGLLSDKEREAKLYEKKIRVLNEKHESLQRSTQSFESEKRQLGVELDKHKELVNQERQKRLKLKQTLKDLTSTERLKWEKECEKRVHAKQLEMEGQVMRRNEKLKQLKDVVHDMRLPEKNQVRLNEIISGGNKENVHVCHKQHEIHQKCDQCQHKIQQVKQFCQHEKVAGVCKTCEQCELKTKQVKKHHREKYQASDQDGYSTPEPKKTKKPPIHPKAHANTTPSKYKNIRSRSPPASLGRKMDVAPIRGKHRRSRSTDFWLNHKPADTLETNNLMQPFIRNKKTVKSPNVKDLKIIPNYILTHQEEDSAGEIETQLIKGEVHETRGGGSSVQFTEIETLTKSNQEKVTKTVTDSPALEKSKDHSKTPKSSNKDGSKSTAKKRKSVDPQSENTDVETRCCVGIEAKKGQAPGLKHNKRLKS